MLLLLARNGFGQLLARHLPQAAAGVAHHPDHYYGSSGGGSPGGGSSGRSLGFEGSCPNPFLALGRTMLLQAWPAAASASCHSSTR